MSPPRTSKFAKALSPKLPPPGSLSSSDPEDGSASIFDEQVSVTGAASEKAGSDFVISFTHQPADQRQPGTAISNGSETTSTSSSSSSCSPRDRRRDGVEGFLSPAVAFASTDTFRRASMQPMRLAQENMTEAFTLVVRQKEALLLEKDDLDRQYARLSADLETTKTKYQECQIQCSVYEGALRQLSEQNEKLLAELERNKKKVEISCSETQPQIIVAPGYTEEEFDHLKEESISSKSETQRVEQLLVDQRQKLQDAIYWMQNAVSQEKDFSMELHTRGAGNQKHKDSSSANVLQKGSLLRDILDDGFANTGLDNPSNISNGKPILQSSNENIRETANRPISVPPTNYPVSLQEHAEKVQQMFSEMLRSEKKSQYVEAEVQTKPHDLDSPLPDAPLTNTKLRYTDVRTLLNLEPYQKSTGPEKSTPTDTQPCGKQDDRSIFDKNAETLPANTVSTALKKPKRSRRKTFPFKCLEDPHEWRMAQKYSPNCVNRYHELCVNCYAEKPKSPAQRETDIQLLRTTSTSSLPAHLTPQTRQGPPVASTPDGFRNLQELRSLWLQRLQAEPDDSHRATSQTQLSEVEIPFRLYAGSEDGAKSVVGIRVSPLKQALSNDGRSDKASVSKILSSLCGPPCETKEPEVFVAKVDPADSFSPNSATTSRSTTNSTSTMPTSVPWSLLNSAVLENTELVTPSVEEQQRDPSKTTTPSSRRSKSGSSMSRISKTSKPKLVPSRLLLRSRSIRGRETPDTLSTMTIHTDVPSSPWLKQLEEAAREHQDRIAGSGSPRHSGTFTHQTSISGIRGSRVSLETFISELERLQQANARKQSYELRQPTITSLNSRYYSNKRLGTAKSGSLRRTSSHLSSNWSDSNASIGSEEIRRLRNEALQALEGHTVGRTSTITKQSMSEKLKLQPITRPRQVYDHPAMLRPSPATEWALVPVRPAEETIELPVVKSVDQSSTPAASGNGHGAPPSPDTNQSPQINISLRSKIYFLTTVNNNTMNVLGMLPPRLKQLTVIDVCHLFCDFVILLCLYETWQYKLAWQGSNIGYVRDAIRSARDGTWSFSGQLTFEFYIVHLIDSLMPTSAVFA